MANLTYAQLEGLWIKAGGPPSQAPVAAAVAEAESGGNPGALNPNDNGGRQSSFGLWQISNGTHTPPSPNWADPGTNASLAVAKYKGAGNTFGPWGTFGSGAYRAYLNGGTTPDMNVPGNTAALTAETGAANDVDCWIGSSGVSGTSWINDLFGGGGNVGKFCLLSKSEGRGFIGALLMAGGVIGSSLALALMMYLAGQRTQLGAQAAGLVNGRTDESLYTAEAGLDAADKASSARAKAAQKAANTPRGRHAKTGANAPATGKHAGP
jgi:hypothetical protein